MVCVGLQCSGMTSRGKFWVGQMRILGVILKNFPRGMPPDPPRMVVPSALPLKLICDVTRLLRNFGPPSEIFCVRHCT